jgi:adenosine deaminase
MNAAPPHYQKLPKVELHRHLEGSLRVSTLVDISRQYGFEDQTSQLLGPQVQIVDGDPLTVANFLAKFAVLRNFYQSPDIIQRVVREAIEDAALDNVRYMELRFTPVALSKVRGFPLGEVISWVSQAAAQASESFGIQVNLLVSVNRHEPLPEAETVVRLAVDYHNLGIVGIDLAGDEVNFPAGPFKQLFREARQAGLHICLHAGEWAGAANVAHAITEMQADRIGHGIRVMEDESVVQMARDADIPFEVCVTSNYQSGIIGSIADHPLGDMLAAGLAATINTDDPGISRITLSDEYDRARNQVGISQQQLTACILRAAQAAFIDTAAKQALLKSLKHDLDDWLAEQPVH